MEEHPEIRQLPQKKKKQRQSVLVMLVALGMFVVSWPLIYLIMSIPGGNDLIGFVLYLCGPLPILPAATFLVGYGMFFCGR